MTPSEHQQPTRDDFDAAVEALYRKGVRLRTENGELRYRAPRGSITADDIAVLHRLDVTRNQVLLLPHQAGTLKLAPLSYNQLSHWHLRGIAAYRPIRQVASVIRIRGRLQPEAMTEAVSFAISRHDSLRTNIVNRDGKVMQQIAETSRGDVQSIDMTGIAQSDRDRETYRQIVSAIVDVTDYSLDQLFKAALLKLEDTESILILAMDHMVSDGTSRSILEREIFTAYEQLVDGREASLPDVQMQYADHAIWQRSTLFDRFKAQESQSRAWRRTRFPVDAPDRGERGLGQVPFALNQRDRAALQEFARRKGTTLVMVVLTAYVALVMRWCGAFETVIQVMSNGRTNRLLENIVGFVAFPLYLHVSVRQRATFTELLDAVTTAYCQACERPDFYYSYTSSPIPEFTRNTCFNWIPRSGGSGSIEAVGAAPSTSRSYLSFDNPVLENLDDLDMEPSVAFEDTGDRIAGAVGFARRRFTSISMTRFVRALSVFLAAISESPAKCIGEIAIA